MRMASFILAIFISFGFGRNLQAQSNLSGTWKGEIRAKGYHWSTIVHIGKSDDSAPPVVRMSFPDWGMYRLAIDSVLINKNEISFKVLWLDAKVKGKLKGELLELDWDRWHKATGTLHLLDRNPQIFKKEDVSLEQPDGANLKGTLIFPNQDPPYNAMVLTHGSGPDTRQTGPYIGKAMLAVENGLAVLVYDKRGAGESTGSGSYRIENLSEDAHAMLRYLEGHPDINQKGIGIGGISQGAWVAPKVAFENAKTSFVFVVATPAVSPAEQNVYTLETRLVASGKDEAEIRFAKKALRALYEYYRTGDQKYRTLADSMIYRSGSNSQKLVFSSALCD